jgi:hypothetical protein
MLDIMLDSVVQWNVRLSHVTLSEVTDLDHLPTLIQILDHVSSRDFSARAEIHTDWERFPSVASDLISPRNQTDNDD